MTPFGYHSSNLSLIALEAVRLLILIKYVSLFISLPSRPYPSFDIFLFKVCVLSCYYSDIGSVTEGCARFSLVAACCFYHVGNPICICFQRYTNADLKISRYARVHIKIKHWKFRILNHWNSRVIDP